MSDEEDTFDDEYGEEEMVANIRDQISEGEHTLHMLQAEMGSLNRLPSEAAAEAAEIEGTIDTFLEFTGGQDRDKARRYLVATGGDLEQAANLFLSGTPLEVLEPPPSSRNNHRNTSRQNLPSGVVLPPFVMERLGEFESRLSGLRSGSHLEAAILALAGGDLEGLLSSAGEGNRNTSNVVINDKDRAKIQIDALGNGVCDKVPEIGTACLRSVATAELYLELGLGRAISEGLTMSVNGGEDAMRFLQLAECVMRIICDGHSAAVSNCCWWFIPARRAGSRRYARASFTETFLERIVPNDDVDGLKQMWFNENFDPSWRGRNEAEMLACALSKGCSIEMLRVLIDPVNGCRANVNPDHDRQGTLDCPLLLACVAKGHDSAKCDLSKEEWSGKAVEVLLDAGAFLDDQVLKSLDKMTSTAKVLVLAEKEGERVSSQRQQMETDETLPQDVISYWWDQDAKRLFRSLLRCISGTKQDVTMHRAMEVLTMLVDRFRPAPHTDGAKILGLKEFDRYIELLQSVFSSENEDPVGLKLISRSLLALLKSTKDLEQNDRVEDDFHSQFCLALCRCGVGSRLKEITSSKIVIDQDHVVESILDVVLDCLKSRLSLNEETIMGKRPSVVDVCGRLRCGDVTVLDQVVVMMGQGKLKSNTLKHADSNGDLNVDYETDDEETNGGFLCGDESITAFEFEQSELPSAILDFLLVKDLLLPDGLQLQDERKRRMSAFLSAMPPPVTGDDGDIDDDEGKLDEEPSLASSIPPDTTDEIGSATGDMEVDVAPRFSFGSLRKSLSSRKFPGSLGSMEGGSLHNNLSAAETTTKNPKAAFSISALYRLISKLQSILGIHASPNFPVISHESTATSGVRALVNPIKVFLSKDESLDQVSDTYPEVQEIEVPVLPLTPLFELHKQLLRSIRISDPRYKSYCEKLVGRKILHRPAFTGEHDQQRPGGGSPSMMSSPGKSRYASPASARSDKASIAFTALVLRYDPYTGAHLLQDITPSSSRIINRNGTKQWFLLTLRQIQILERVFDYEEQTPVLQFSLADPSTKTGVESLTTGGFRVDEKVAVWWCGDETIGPGWRSAKILKIQKEVSSILTFNVEYDGDETMFDSTVRVGDFVQLIDDAVELEALSRGHGGFTEDMLKYRGETGKVTAIRNQQANVEGFGKYVFNTRALVRVPSPVKKKSIDSEALPSRIHIGVPQKRVWKLEDVKAMDDRHVFSVMLRPDESIFKPSDSNESVVSDRQESQVGNLRLNDRIEGRYAGKSRYYKGRVARVNVDGTYDIAYDDGDSERGVKPIMLCNIGKGPGKVISFDFRKVFPNSTGRSLFDALRREDGVINGEYNFVTRGFEHQPSFYSSFAKTLEETGAGVFAQFQTKRQAELLFERIQKSSAGTVKTSRSLQDSVFQSDRADDVASETTNNKKLVSPMVDIFPDAVLPAVVERDIYAAFESVQAKFGAVVSHKPPPPPGHRAQVNAFAIDFVDPGSRLNQDIEDDSGRWCSATVLGRRSIEDTIMLLTCVLDDGRILWDVPSERVRVAQRHSKNFPFKTKERNDDDMSSLTPVSKPAGESRTEHEPVELSRQFTAFGQSTAYKHIQFEGDIDDTLDIDAFVDNDTGSEFEDDEDSMLLQPRLEFDFMIERKSSTSIHDMKGSEDNLYPLLVTQSGGISIFQCLFQLFSGVAAEDGDVKAEQWSNEYHLKWRLRCIFPDDNEYYSVSTSLKDKLPYRTPRALVYEVTKPKSTFTLEEFCFKVAEVVPDFEDWAQKNQLQDVLDCIHRRPSKNKQLVNWAAITAAYAELCQRRNEPSVSTPIGLQSPMSPIRSPFRDFLNIKSIGLMEDTQDDMITHITSVLEECGIEESVKGLRDTLVLLHLLHHELVPFDEAADPLAAAFGKSLPWRNEILSELLREQLSDPLSIATRCFPVWCANLPSEFSFLFQTKVRQIHMRCTALGVSRAVAWLQDEVTGLKAKKRQLANLTLELHGMFVRPVDPMKVELLSQRSDKLEDEVKSIELEHCIGQLHQDLVKVDRSELLHDAELLMHKHMNQRSELVVQFVNETGAGEGVTIDFYASVASRLQLIEENKNIPMWICHNSPAIVVAALDGAETASSAYEEELHISCSRGLFPQPLLPMGSVTGDAGSRVDSKMGLRVNTMAEGKDSLELNSTLIEGTDPLQLARERNRKVLRRFRFLGRLMAKALLDGWNVPIPLSPEFFMLLQQRQQYKSSPLPISTLSLIEGDDNSFGIVSRLHQVQHDKSKLSEILDELDLRFIDPSQHFRRESTDTEASACGAMEPPVKGAPVEELIEFAEAASSNGWTQSMLETTLSEAGHSKLLRWKAIKASQNIRTKIMLAKQDREDHMVPAVELCVGGGDIRVTTENVGEYLALVLEWWLNRGVELQADSFADGLRDVLGIQGRDALLRNFSHSELRRMLCGKEEIQWKDEDPLLGFIVPMGGYTASSPPVVMLVEALKEMTMRERSQFLSFSTSLPRVPLSGLPQIKVFPPVIDSIPGLVLKRETILKTGDVVTLSDDYAYWSDAENGPLQPGEEATVSRTDGKVCVSGWWYNSNALSKKITEPSTADDTCWFAPGDIIHASRVRATVGSWDPDTLTLLFDKTVDMSARQSFKVGEPVSAEGRPRLRIAKVLEEPQAIQMRPYLRPKATTCAKTLYLPRDYDDHKHMLEIFQAAFHDAKLGGINDQ